MSAKTERNKALVAACWFLKWIGLTIAIIACGAASGAVIFPVGGFLLGVSLEISVMIRNGILDGGFYAMIWAPGISFVVCLMAIRKQMFENPDKES